MGTELKVCVWGGHRAEQKGDAWGRIRPMRAYRAGFACMEQALKDGP